MKRDHAVRMSALTPGLLTRGLLALLAATATLLAGAGAARAATFTVDDATDAALQSPSSTSCVSSHGGSCTLRAAVQAADNAGGANQIVLPAGDYKLTIPPATASTTGDPATGDLDVVELGSSPDALTITGAGSASTIVNANLIDRAFAVQSGNALKLSGMTIEGGDPGVHSTASDEGGAIYSDGSLTVAGDVVFSGNTGSGDGGAIYADAAAGSTLALTGATFTGNSAPFGGAIYDDIQGTASISGSSFSSDAADPSTGFGGAIVVEGGSLTVASSSFSSDSAGDGGGGIYWNSAGTLTATGSAFASNTAGEGGAIRDDSSAGMTLSDDSFSDDGGATEGGALYLLSGSSTAYALTGDEFDSNSASASGGAIQWGVGTLTVSGSSFIGNSAGLSGGALEADSTNTLSLTNATISQNAAEHGGGIYFLGGTVPVSLVNDTIAFNTAAAGAGIYGPDAGEISATRGVLNTIVALNAGGDCNVTFAAGTDAGHNLDGDGSCFGGLGATGDQTSVSAPLIGAPTDNGGPVETDALETGSPAIDAGGASGCPSTDARGVARPQGAGCDVGAYERASAGITLSSSAPSSVTVGVPFNVTLSVSGTGPGPSTASQLTVPLPSGTVLYGTASSQGSCTSSGWPAIVRCGLGAIDTGATARVVLIVAASGSGRLAIPASAANGEGGSANASLTVSATAAAPAPSRPAATSGGASAVTPTAATLSGHVSPGGQSTAWFFQYGTSRGYGQATPVKTTSSTARVTSKLRGLLAATRYRYRLVAINSSGVSYGADRTVKTDPPRRTKVTVHIKSVSARRLPIAYTFAGRLVLPAGVTKKAGCTGTVAVTVVVIRNGQRVQTVRAPVRRDCTYTASMLVAPPYSVPPPGPLEVIVRFKGTHLLPRSSSKPLTLPYG
jgi:predicted outer membrane repeat protein